MKKSLFIAVLAVIISSCGSTEKTKKTDVTMWVNSMKAPCEGVAPMSCMLVQKGENIIPGEWELFYDHIKGFEYQEGYIYKLCIEEKQLDAKDVPADASTTEYILVEELEKNADPRVLLNDIWRLSELDGDAVSKAEAAELPYMEINLRDMAFMGNDGCNNFRGNIKSLDEKKIVLGPAMGTKKACPDMSISNKFNKALASVASYKYEKMILSFYDKEGNKLMKLKKTD